MGWGTLWQVEDSARELLSNRRTKAEWYEALEPLDIENAPELNAEDSVRFWSTVLDGRPGPLGRLFAGEMHAAFDEYDDPNVLFLGRDLVAEIAPALGALNEEYFAELFRSRDDNWACNAWFFDPLRAFHSAASN